MLLTSIVPGVKCRRGERKPPRRFGIQACFALASIFPRGAKSLGSDRGVKGCRFFRIKFENCLGFLLTSVDLGDGVDPDGSADVDVPGDGGAAGEVPVLVVGGELLGHVRLDDVDPVGEGHLARP